MKSQTPKVEKQVQNIPSANRTVTSQTWLKKQNVGPAESISGSRVSRQSLIDKACQTVNSDKHILDDFKSFLAKKNKEMNLVLYKENTKTSLISLIRDCCSRVRDEFTDKSLVFPLLNNIIKTILSNDTKNSGTYSEKKILSIFFSEFKEIVKPCLVNKGMGNQKIDKLLSRQELIML